MGAVGAGAPTLLTDGGRAPTKSKPSDIANQQDLPLFITATPRFSQKLLRIASRIDHCAYLPLFLCSRQQ